MLKVLAGYGVLYTYWKTDFQESNDDILRLPSVSLVRQFHRSGFCRGGTETNCRHFLLIYLLLQSWIF